MEALRQEIRFASTPDGQRIAFASLGHGYPLVKTGHWMTHLEWDWQTPVWGPWIRALSEGRRLVRYDIRGCGLSDRRAAPGSLDQMVEDLEAVVDALALERLALLGCSQGGAVAMTYAARHPDRVSHLVLCDAYARGALVRRPGRANEEIIEALCRLVQAGWGQSNAAYRQLFTTQFFPGGSREHAESFNDLQRLSCSPEYAAQLVRALAQVDATASLEAIRCPTLVLHCRGDVRVPFEEGLFIAASIQGARFVPLESPNHVPLAGEPAFDELMAQVRDFLPAPGTGRAPSSFAGLTAAERQLVQLLARGLDNAQIGAHLGLAEKTVRNKVSMVFAKLQVHTRAQAIVRAREAGFGEG